MKKKSKEYLSKILSKSKPKISLFKKKIKEIKKDLKELKHRFSKSIINRHRNLFCKVNKDYFKPIKTKSAFNDNYIKYESKWDKDKKIINLGMSW